MSRPGALEGALENSPAGGGCPEGRKAEDGAIPDRYPVEVLPGAGYRQRTIRNIVDSDATVILTFGPPEGGTALTVAQCARLEKPHLVIDAEVVSADLVEQHDVAVLNVAGPRESKSPGAHTYTASVIGLVLTSDPGMDTGMDAG